jgi:hypothetical protein
MGANTDDSQDDMGASGAPEISRTGEIDPPVNGRIVSVRERLHDALPHATPFLTSAIVVAVAVGFVALVTYFGARTFTSRAADDRAAQEAASFAMHSSLLATGDAFNGYLQILRYSDDPVVRVRDIAPEARRDAMQQLLWLNTNKMASLAVADRSGLVLVSTDDSIRNVRASTAFNESRANLGPANSDIVLPATGARGYVEFTAPLRDADGAVWAFLYARAEPQVLWRDTLNATIDGGHNVIINSEGLFSAGVPESQLRQLWAGSPLDNGSVRADIAGVTSICGLGAIGKDTQIDHGWFVASCLPASLIQVEAGRALGNQGLITLAAAVLAVVIALGLLRIMLGGAPGSATTTAVDRRDEDQAQVDPEPPALESAEPLTEPEPPAVEATPSVVIVPDVDALTVIEAYERRNALLAEELRESVQARIMIAAAQVDEALRLLDDEPERARTLQRSAIDELGSIRERELRTIGQELHPGMVRLGLPGALRSLRKEFEGSLELSLEVDASVDGASSRGGRTTIDARLRWILYRIARDAVRLARDAGADRASVAVTRDGLEVTLTIHAQPPAAISEASVGLAAGEVALKAFDGRLICSTDHGLRIIARVLAPHVEQAETEESRIFGEGDASDDEPSLGHSGVVTTFTLPDREPEVIDESVEPSHLAVRVPPAASTFRLPDDTPHVVESTGPPVEPTPAPDEDLPRVVQIGALSELTDDAAIEGDADPPGDSEVAAAEPETTDSEDAA